ncbi:hypothetical protein [Sphingopyxis sp. GW247-27LB]|uniref:hypothetical protein n=1 Tax=Sphingopyxis sp. GW247-27LB TaxID=2012632 RepID=UPI000BA6A5E3|nr:hypothetical protein [Sphingopyxis sp. GW247-27LB]PAL23539.1 hypothetical protein CD928_05585 [Sphingopyxis sp. GW247-27LB]
MRAHGHTNVGLYPIHLIREEARIIEERLSMDLASHLTGMTMVGASLLGGKEGTRLLNDFIEGLTEE